MTTPDDAYDFRRAARSTVLAAAGGSIGIRPEPLAGIRAARSLEHAAARVAGDYIRHAREEGRDWREIGEALGLAPDDGDIATAAWEHAAGPRYRMDPLSFWWTCPACGKGISDYGPYGGHPEDAEHGHAEGCARMAEAVRAYMAQWEDGEDDD